MAEYHNFTLPTQFGNSTINQHLRGSDITLNAAQTNKTLQDIQNVIWRRILSDLPEIRRTKGTRSSIEGVLRSIGINPGTTFRIKEYGGPHRSEIANTYEKRTRIGAMLDFSGSLSSPGTLDGEGPRALLHEAQEPLPEEAQHLIVDQYHRLFLLIH